MKLIEMTTEKQFLKLEKNDLIIVEWSDFYVKHHEKSQKVMTYNIHENKKRSDEIICKLKGNHYFNWKMYLGLDSPGINTSQALKVYKVEVEDETVE